MDPDPLINITNPGSGFYKTDPGSVFIAWIQGPLLKRTNPDPLFLLDGSSGAFYMTDPGSNFYWTDPESTFNRRDPGSTFNSTLAFVV